MRSEGVTFTAGRCAQGPRVNTNRPLLHLTDRTLAPLRALRARTPVPAWARRVVGEGVRSCPRAGCGKSACRFDERDVADGSPHVIRFRRSTLWHIDAG